jgi:hypothetical protein
MHPAPALALRGALTLALALLVACAQIGLPAPETTNEKIAAAQVAVTQVRTSAAQLLLAGKISSADGMNVLRTTDAAAEGIMVARALAAQDPNAAQARLTMVATALTAIQTYLASRR